MNIGAEPDRHLLELLEEDLADVERALARLDEGTYGTCEVCGGQIADDRLAETPAGRRCAAHAQPAAPGT